MNRLVAVALVTAASACLPAPTRAEVQNCINITSLPAVIGSQGVYCLKQDLATSISIGTAIEITANNVTLDCNGHKLGGIGAGPETQAVGIGSSHKSNTTIRNCNVRGFSTGVSLAYDGNPDNGPSGNVVENNRIDRSTRTGIYIAGDSSVVRGNLVFNTGSVNSVEPLVGIEAHMSVDVTDNTIEGMVNQPQSKAGGSAIATWHNVGGTVANNRIRKLQTSIAATGILNTHASVNMLIKDNVITGAFVVTPISCVQSQNLAVGNVALDSATVLQGCTDGGGNITNQAP